MLKEATTTSAVVNSVFDEKTNNTNLSKIRRESAIFIRPNNINSRPERLKRISF